MALYSELRKRHVLEIALVYLGVAWLFIEITQFVVGNYGFSRKVLDAVFLIAALGFPAFIVIAWYHGEKGPQRVRRGELSLLLTLGVLGAIGTFRIATGEEIAVTQPPDERVEPAASSDASLASSEAPAADLGRSSLAVLPFKNNISDPDLAWMGSGLADLLTTNFAQIEPLRVVGRQTLYDLLTEEGRGENEEIPEALASTVARAAGARMMLWGTISGTAEDLVIDAQLIDLQNGTVRAGERVRGSDVFVMVDSLTARLTREVAGERPGPPPMAISSFGTSDLDALAAFQQGVQSERAGRRDEATRFYERAAELDTTFMLPSIRLAGGTRLAVPEVPEDVDVGDFARMDFEDIEWDELDEDERRALRAARRAAGEEGRRVSQIHKERAVRLLEKMGAGELGRALVTNLEGMTREEFIMKFDSTLSETLATVNVVTTRAARDTAGND